ncbi:MAG: hypothetical protein ACK46Q_16820, partial [Hyphomonas sp.]
TGQGDRVMRNMLQAMLIAGLVGSLAPAALAQGDDETARCGHRLEELRQLQDRVLSSDADVERVADRIITRLQALADDGLPVCLEAGQLECVDPIKAQARNDRDSHDLMNIHRAFRAQRRQYNEYIPFFSTTCIDSGYGRWEAGQAPEMWAEDDATDELVTVVQDFLAAEREWLRLYD